MCGKLSGWLVLMLIISACTSQQVETAIPTQTLIPPTITPTATPLLPTQTPQNLPEPQDLIVQPSLTPLSPLVATTLTFDSDIVEFTRRDLANHLGIVSDRLQLVKVRPRIYLVVNCSTGRSPTPAPMTHGLEVTWIADDQVYVYLTWDDDEFVWCETDRLHGEALIAIDPIAAELTALAIRRVSQQTDNSTDSIVLLDILPVEWQDSSLGCPQAGQVYADSQIDGYRIVVADEEANYLFHTDSVQLVLCDFERASN